MSEGAITVIQIQKEMIEDIPVLHVGKDQVFKEKAPLVIFIHGFESAKEHNLHYAYLLAEKGFRVVLPEILFHGERQTESSQMEVLFKFWEIILKTIHEINVIKNYYVKSGNTDADRIGLVGTSMGGIITSGALTKYDWIKAAVILMGSPNYEAFALEQIQKLKNNGIKIPLTDKELQDQISALEEYDLSKHLELIKMRPILFWHGVKDNMVPYQPTYDFYKTIQYLYAEAPERLEFITDKNSGHKVSRNGLLKTVDWFERWL